MTIQRGDDEWLYDIWRNELTFIHNGEWVKRKVILNKKKWYLGDDCERLCKIAYLENCNKKNANAVYEVLDQLGVTDLGTRREFYNRLNKISNRAKVYDFLESHNVTNLISWGFFEYKLGFATRFSIEADSEEIMCPNMPYAPFGKKRL
jgi:hypothetical protein